MKAVLRPLPRVSHSLAAFILIWLRGAWYLWRGKATYGQALSSTTYMPRVHRFYNFIFNWSMHRYCFARTGAFQETNVLCRMKQMCWLVAACFLTAVKVHTSQAMNFVTGITATCSKKQVHVINQRPFCTGYYYWHILKDTDRTRSHIWHMQAFQYLIGETAV